MVKPPRIRHSKPRREPVTIDLDATAVKRDVDAPGGTEAERVASAETAGDTAPPASEPGGATTQGSRPPMTGASDTRSDGPAMDAAARPAAESAAKAAAAQPASPFGRDAATARTGSAASSRPPSTGPSASPAPGASTTVPPQQEPAKRSGGRSAVSLLAAGIVGGVVALGGQSVLESAGLLPIRGGEGGEIARLETQIASLRADVEAAAGADTSAVDARIGEVGAAVEALRAELETVKSSAGAGSVSGADALAALERRLGDAESAISSLRTDVPDAAAIGSLSQRLDAAETLARTATDTATGAASSADAAATATSAATERIAAIEQRLAAVDERLDQQADNPRIALAIAAAGLKSAIDRGVPFMTELETYAAIAPEAPEIATLRDLAATGVPTRADIAARVPAAVTRMTDAAEPVDPNAGFFTRLFASLQSLVKVRPVGEVAGEGVGPTAARIEAAVIANDYARALSEYDSLPEIAKAAAADFIADVRARQSTDALVDRALSGALRSEG